MWSETINRAVTAKTVVPNEARKMKSCKNWRYCGFIKTIDNTAPRYLLLIYMTILIF